MTTDRLQNVSRRQVFYIPGYDPFPPRRYRELYRTEAAEQARISDYQIELVARDTDGPFGWQVNSEIDGAATRTQIDVMVWSDIVSKSMANDIPRTYWQLLQTAWIYGRSGAFRQLMSLRKGPMIAALYPVVMLLGQLIAALIAWSVVAGTLGWLFAGAFAIFGAAPPAGLAYWVGWLFTAAGITAAVLLLRWFKRMDNKLFAYYLMHDYAYSAQYKGENPSELEQRMKTFKDFMALALRTNVDEVLVVGHSSGAHLAVSILADLIREGKVHVDGPKLAFLSLGHVIPMMSFLPKADKLRGDLNLLAGSDQLTWIDISAPGDGCAFALCDPVSVTGVEPEDKKWPLVLSAAFTQTLSEERWSKLRWRFFKLHFQYLCAFDRPGDYDYFQITAGPVLLADRYAGREPSRSRIDIALSPHRSMSAG